MHHALGDTLYSDDCLEPVHESTKLMWPASNLELESLKLGVTRMMGGGRDQEVPFSLHTQEKLSLELAISECDNQFMKLTLRLEKQLMIITKRRQIVCCLSASNCATSIQ